MHPPNTKGVIVECHSGGWFPRPLMQWRDRRGEVIPAASKSHSQGRDKLFNMKISLLISESFFQKVICCLQNPLTGQEERTSVILSGNVCIFVLQYHSLKLNRMIHFLPWLDCLSSTLLWFYSSYYFYHDYYSFYILYSTFPYSYLSSRAIKKIFIWRTFMHVYIVIYNHTYPLSTFQHTAPHSLLNTHISQLHVLLLLITYSV